MGRVVMLRSANCIICDVEVQGTRGAYRVDDINLFWPLSKLELFDGLKGGDWFDPEDIPLATLADKMSGITVPVPLSPFFLEPPEPE